jgi:glycerophosphoryl diester phosphodiesterase
VEVAHISTFAAIANTIMQHSGEKLMPKRHTRDLKVWHFHEAILQCHIWTVRKLMEAGSNLQASSVSGNRLQRST